MKIKFDKNKYLKFLKEKQRLKNEIKSLRNDDKIKYDELSSSLKLINKEITSFLGLISDEMDWRTRHDYLQLLKVFIRKEISLNEFFQQFGILYNSSMNSSDIWIKNLEKDAFTLSLKSDEINYHVNPESYGFSDMIHSLKIFIDVCDPDIPLELNLEDPESIFIALSEDMFRFLIEENFIPRIEIYCNKS